MAAPIRFLSGRNQQQKIGIEGSTDNQKVLEVVGRVGIGTTIFEPTSEFEVRGDAIVSGIITAGSIDVSSGEVNFDDVNVSGASTFAGAADFNGSIDVDGHTELDNVNVSGVSTFVGLGTFKNDLYVSDNVYIAGFVTATRLYSSVFGEFTGSSVSADNLVGSALSISGLSTFTGAADFNGSIDVDGHTELDDLNVSGVSTFAGAADFNGSIDVDGHTELDNVNVSGAITATTFTGNLAGTVNTASQPNITSLGTLTGLDVNGHSELDNVNVSGVSTFTGAADFNGSIDVDGHTELDNVNVSGAITATTFTGNLAGTVNTAAQPNITSLGTLSALTVSGDITANGNIAGDNSTNITGIAGVTATTLSGTLQTAAQTNITSVGTLGALTVSGDITANGNIAGDNSTNITGIAGVTATTLSGTLQTAAQTNVTSVGTLTSLDVTGHTELDNVNVSGIITTASLNATGKLTTTGIGISIANGTGNTAYIEGPAEIWIDPHPFGVGQTSGSVRIRGDLYVDGTEFIVNVDKIELGDFNIGIASTVSTNSLLDGAGLGIGATGIRKTITWNNSTSALMSSENWNLASGKHYEIAGTDVLTSDTLGSGVVNSSLTSVGTLGALTVSGNVNANGNIIGDGATNISGINSVTAVTFHGSGGELTDLINQRIEGLQIFDDGTNIGAGYTFASLDVVGNNVSISAIGIGTTAKLIVSDTPTYDSLKVTGISTFSGNVNANGNIIGDGATNISGINSVTATSFHGNGASLTSLNASQLSSGTVPAARLSGTYDINITGSIDGIGQSIGIDTITVNKTLTVGAGNTFLKSDLNGNLEVTGVVTATTFSGNLPTSDLTGTITNAQLAGSIANSKLSNDSVSFGGVSVDLGASDATPAFNLSDATAYPTSSLVGTITNAQLAGSIANAKLANSSIAIGGVTLNLGDTDATPAFDLSDATNYPTSSLSGTITNAQLAGSIANSKLANDSVSFGGVSVDLGASDATPAFDLSDATAYPTSSLVGTITNAQLAGSIADGKLASTFLKNVVEDTTPQLGGNLDFNSKFITGTGGINVSGVVTATTFVGNLTGTASNASGATSDFSIADKIVHTGDTNTALRFPAADTFTVETGGSERVRVSSAGNVGINSTVPSEKLDVLGNIKSSGTINNLTVGRGAGNQASNTALGFQALNANTTGTSNVAGGYQSLLNNDSGLNNTGFGYGSLKDNTSGDYNIGLGLFSAQNIQTGNNNVGLGAHALNDLVSGSSNVAIGYYAGRYLTGSNNTILGAYQGTASETSISDTVIISAGTAERLRITSAGLVGIGITNPTSKLHVVGDVTIADKIIHDGDTNTAIRFPAADTFTVETGGSEALRVDSGGRLLSGTNSNFDNFKTQISSTSGSLLSVRRTNSNPGSIKISSGASGDNVVLNTGLGYIRWYGFHTSADYEAARISAEVDNGPGANDMPGRLIFSTTADGAAAPTERLRIDSAGLVGIGTDNPGNLNGNGDDLVVGNGAGNRGITIFTGANNTGNIYFADGTTGSAPLRGGITYAHDDNSLKFLTNALERLRITSAGNVGINSTVPSEKLDVLGNIKSSGTINNLTVGRGAGNQASNTALGFQALNANTTGTSNVAGGYQSLLNNDSGLNNTGFGYGSLKDNTSGDYNIGLGLFSAQNIQTGNNNVGLGAHALNDLVSGSSNVAIGYYAGRYLTGSNNTILGAYQGTASETSISDTVIISAGTAERLRITSAGLVGIGITNPTSKLHVVGDVTIADKIIHDGDTNTAIRFPAADTFTVETGGSEALRVDSGGRLLSGTNSNFDNFKTQISSTSGSLLSVRRTNSNPGSIKISSGASGDNVVLNTGLGYIRWYGFHTSADYEAARISAEVDNGPGANDMPGRLIFSTTADGAAAPTERLRIDSAGNVGINSTIPSSKLDVVGDAKVTGIITASSLDAAISEWVLGADGSSNYTFTGPGLTGAENDPSIYLVRGQKYNFKNSSGGHPFRIQSTPNGSTGTQYNDGITNNDAGNGTTLNWNVQFDAPGVLYYQCTSHAAMGGKIYIGNSGESIIVGAAVTITSSGINATGVVTATSFVGDGSTLTGIAAGGSGEFNTGITSSRQIAPLSFESTVFTFPSTAGRQYVIESINIANVDASVGVGTTVNIIASIQDATAAEQTYIAYNVPIVTGGLIELLKNPIVAGPSDVIRMWSTNDAYVGVNNATEVYMSYSEFESTDYISKFASTASVTSTDTTTLYTSTSNPTVIEKIGFANRTDIGDFPISIKITNGTSTSYLAKDLIIPRYSTVDILDRPKRIETGAKIEVEVGSTSTVDVIIAGKKITS